MSEETHSPSIMSLTNFMVTLENLGHCILFSSIVFFIRAKDLTVTLKKFTVILLLFLLYLSLYVTLSVYMEHFFEMPS